MAAIQVIDGHERDLGGFSVRRILPAASRQMVGPFIFLDHLGPAEFPPGRGIDVRPHPHIGLATVTYLFSGELEHRDSLGNDVVIKPGDVNWMTAGCGIAHSERTPQSVRHAGPRIHGIQSWVALRDGREDVEPTFVHHAAASLPRINLGDVEVTLMAGCVFGCASPVATLWPTLYAHVELPGDAALELPSEQELAVYVVSGTISVDGIMLTQGQMGILDPGTTHLQGVTSARVMLLGGHQFATQRHIYWNFVASSPERIELAKRRWQAHDFPTVPGETEFIPLPS